MHLDPIYSILNMVIGTEKLEYLCEAKLLETNREDDLEVCHVPFRLNGDPNTWHYGCAQTMADTGKHCRKQGQDD